MRPKVIITSLLALLLSIPAFAHNGHKHQFLGTVKSVAADRLVVTTIEKTDVSFVLTKATTYVKGDAPATARDLKEGVRVSVYVQNDGRTARNVKIAK